MWADYNQMMLNNVWLWLFRGKKIITIYIKPYLKGIFRNQVLF